jgi:hypothetical protein
LFVQIPHAWSSFLRTSQTKSALPKQLVATAFSSLWYQDQLSVYVLLLVGASGQVPVQFRCSSPTALQVQHQPILITYHCYIPYSIINLPIFITFKLQIQIKQMMYQILLEKYEEYKYDIHMPLCISHQVMPL